MSDKYDGGGASTAAKAEPTKLVPPEAEPVDLVCVVHLCAQISRVCRTHLECREDQRVRVAVCTGECEPVPARGTRRVRLVRGEGRGVSD